MLMDASLDLKPVSAIRSGTVLTNAVNLQCANVGNTETPFTDSKPKYNKISELSLMVQVTEKFVGCTSLQAKLMTCATEGGQYSDVVSASAPVADLKPPFQFRFSELPTGLQAYNKLAFVVSGTATAGAVNAAFVDNKQTNSMS